MSDEYYIQRCIELADKGRGRVAPNPMVGAVIVYNNEIIGEGYHQQYGHAHAEVNAVNSVKDQNLLKESTIYVSLEPCAHFGKTPPCANLLVEKQFKRVVIGCIDTFSKVSGMGIKRLKDAGIDVTVGVLEDTCRELNKRFFTFHEKKRPYIILKWAQTQDGFLDKNRSEGELGINWITQPQTKRLVHQWRAEESAIMIGKNTALNDNPSLTVREFEGQNPIRILLDRNLEIPANAAIYSDEAPTIVFNNSKSEEKGTNKWIMLNDFKVNSIVSHLYELNIQSVIIEGGAHVLQSFIEANCWDEARVLTGTSKFHDGLKAPVIQSSVQNTFEYGLDQVTIYRQKA